MPYPSLLSLPKQEDYRKHFESKYCCGPIAAFDGISVRFRKRDFDHAFFESHSRTAKKDTFSLQRAERMDWIAAALQDQASERYVGWDKAKKRYDRTRRVTVVMSDYVVVIALKKGGYASFITAYVADSCRTLNLIRSGPVWA